MSEQNHDQAITQWMQSYAKAVDEGTQPVPDYRRAWLYAQWRRRQPAKPEMNRTTFVLELAMQCLVLLIGGGLLVWYRADVEVLGIAVNPIINRVFSTVTEILDPVYASTLPVLDLPSYSLALCLLAFLCTLVFLWNRRVFS